MTFNDRCTKVIYRERRTRRLYIHQVLDFSIYHFHQVFDFFYQKTVFEFFHTNEKFFLLVVKLKQKQHLTLIVNIIESDVLIEVSQRKKAMMSHFKKR
jgi:hypothetical protein